MSLSDKRERHPAGHFCYPEGYVREFIKELKQMIDLETMGNPTRSIAKNSILRKVDKLAGEKLL